MLHSQWDSRKGVTWSDLWRMCENRKWQKIRHFVCETSQVALFGNMPLLKGNKPNVWRHGGGEDALIIITCSKSIITTKRTCVKYAQYKQQNHQVKYVKLSFYKCAHFLLTWLLSTLWIYHFHCWPMLFLPILKFPPSFPLCPHWFPTFLAFPPSFPPQLPNFRIPLLLLHNPW